MTDIYPKKIEPNFYPTIPGAGSWDADLNGMPLDAIPEPNAPLVAPSTMNIVDGPNGSVMKGGQLQSPNFVTGVSGWIIRADGSVEFADGVFRGSLTAATIDIGGSDASSFHVDADGNTWWGASTFAAAPAKVSNAGDATFRSVDSTVSMKIRNLGEYTAGEAIDASSTPQLVYKSSSDGKIYKADADDNTKRRWFGFVDNAQNVALNATVEVVSEGIVSGFSGLTNGQYVYMTNTAGSISHTPSTTFVGRVGIAVSATEILMFPKGIKQVSGSVSTACNATDQTTTVTVGFRPRLILAFTFAQGNASGSCNGEATVCSGAYSDSATQGASYGQLAANTGGVYSGYVCRSTGNAAGDVDVTIGNVTETSFDVTFDKSGGAPGTAKGDLFYVAFAE